jgi:Phage Mu protein F like protein
MIDHEKLIADAFFRVVGDIINDTQINEIIKAIDENDLERVLRALGVQEAVWEPLTDALSDAYKAAGIKFGETFPRGLRGADGYFNFRFMMRNPTAERWLAQQSGTLIRSITEDMRSNVREITRSGMERGLNPRKVALDIVGRLDRETGKRVGGVIGLTEAQQGWVRNYTNKLRSLDAGALENVLRDKRFDSIVKRAVETGQPLKADQIANLTERYRVSILNYRGASIARSEMLQSQSAAEFDAVRQVRETGAVPDSAIKRAWDATEDARTRPSHRHMEGQVVGPQEAFTLPNGQKLMYPGDKSLGADASELIMCRCRARPQIDWLQSVK